MSIRRGIRRGLGSLTAVPLVVGIVIVVNLLAVAFYVRADMTDSKLYSLSDASKKIARSLDDPVVVKLYFSQDLPSPYNQNARYLKDQLYEYRSYSGGKLRFEFIDPIKQDRESEAHGYGIPAVQVNAVEKDKIELKKVYMGAVFLYEDKREVLPVIQSTDNLEYELSSTILKVTTDKLPRVGILQGHGERQFGDGFQVGYQVLSQLYTVEPVTIEAGQPVDDQLAALLIINPTDSISAWDQYAIDQYIMHGGKIALFFDPVQVDISVQQAKPLDNNWESFLRHYGIGFKTGLVLDARNSRIAVMQQQGNIRFQNVVDFPFLPQIFAFNPDNQIGKDLEAVDMPFVSPVDSTVADSEGYHFEAICWSSERSGIRKPPYYLSPLQQFTAADFNEPHQPLAAVVFGSFKSAFPGGPPPGTTPATDSVLTMSPPNRLVYTGDAEFCSEQQLSRNPSNASLFLNIVDWLTQEEGLISIRSREVVSRPLDEISDGKRQAVKYANIFGPPLLVIAFGVVRWQSRRRKKRG